MPVLSNSKHERFAQELAKGKTASEAYVLAGYKANDGNASTLKGNQNVSARVEELQSRAAKRTEITIETLTDMYLEDRKLAHQVGQPGAARAAADSLARIHGRWIDRKEIGSPGEFSRMTDDELDRFIAEREGKAGSGSSRARATPDPIDAGVRGRLN